MIYQEIHIENFLIFSTSYSYLLASPLSYSSKIMILKLWTGLMYGSLYYRNICLSGMCDQTPTFLSQREAIHLSFLISQCGWIPT